MSDELPAAAIEAAAETWVFAQCHTMAENRNVARAVLLAASERVPCPACQGEGHHGYRDGEPNPMLCSVCAGSGFLYVLKQETP